MADGNPPDERLLEEIEFLRNVYTSDEVHVEDAKGDKVNMVVMTIHPATAGEVSLQYVCLQLHVALPPTYPDEVPLIEIRNPRGLSENEVRRLKQALEEYIGEERGSPVLMQLFELARDYLTNTNVPHGVCAVCLSDFVDSKKEFLKTDCYHYFHTTCLIKYKSHWLAELEQEPSDLPVYQEAARTELVCPECRKPIRVPEGDTLEADDEHEQFEYKASREIVAMQEKWRKMYNKQLAQGGIIDLEKEREKHRLPPLPKADVKTNQASSGDDLPDIEGITINSAAVVSQPNAPAGGSKPQASQSETKSCDKKPRARENTQQERRNHDEHSRRRQRDSRYNSNHEYDGKPTHGNQRRHRTNKRFFQNNAVNGNRKEVHASSKSSEVTGGHENYNTSDPKVVAPGCQTASPGTSTARQNTRRHELKEAELHQATSVTDKILATNENTCQTSAQDAGTYDVQVGASATVEGGRKVEAFEEIEHKIKDRSCTTSAQRGVSGRSASTRHFHDERRTLTSCNGNPQKHTHSQRDGNSRGRRPYNGHRPQTHHFRPSGSAHQRGTNSNRGKKTPFKAVDGSEGF